jgi:glycosyltransferase involved in cell wall biosynthesis
MSVYIDLTEFLGNPILTGIQRVTAEICRWWPNKDLRPVRLADGKLVEMPGSLISAIARCFKDVDGAAVREVCTLREKAIAAVLPDGPEVILVPELFYDPQRVAFFRHLDDRSRQRYRFIIYDLMPILHPEYFAPDMPHDIISGYFSMVRRIPHCGFISEWTQHTYCRRLLRSSGSTGVVLRLGSDGLGPEPATSLDYRPLHFCTVGTIEPRKNHALILDAFEPLLRTVEGLQLTFLGRLGWVDSAFRQRLEWMAGNCPGFEWIPDGSDDCIRQHVEGARATVYVSSAEGFGLPPVESLWLGTPVIASPNLPSLELIGSQGVEIVDPLDAVALRKAVTKFTDDTFALSKVREAREVDLPTWASFARQIADWCGAPKSCGAHSGAAVTVGRGIR